MSRLFGTLLVSLLAAFTADGRAGSPGSNGAPRGGRASHSAPPPVWAELPFPVAGCSVERLVPATRLFDWKPCEAAKACAEAVWNRDVVGPDAEIGRRTMVDDDGQTVRIAVRYDSDAASQAGVVLAREDGSVELGLRVSTRGPCNMNIPSIGHGRFGVLVTRSASPEGSARKGGLLAPLADLGALTPFEISPLPRGSGPDSAAWGSSRWLWRFAPDELSTFSNIDGKNFTAFAKLSDSIRRLGGPTSTGASFLFDVVEVAAGGVPEAYIARSDGVAPAQRFISSTSGSWVGVPLFAHSHIGWQKGIHPHANEFDSVELWASPYTEQASRLAPYKVGTLAGKGWTSVGAGWGRYVTLEDPDRDLHRDFLVWDLEKKTSRDITLPADRYFEACAGLTRSALWIVPGLESSVQRGLMRFSL